MNPRARSGLKFRSKLLGINQNTSTPVGLTKKYLNTFVCT